ncbi:flagellar motor switch protein FliN [Aquisalimonas lutea]|uniref:flagellar motor switch protein FliN n=1 Tax=Aquisalimonas lutea TaxID=1327750 RepID=UPI0025B43F23|nr:flagellar motor switch protein FliN [Aquisalimonas lutea]MDN3518288.1 flagellar motor switch protein FliN [Aquisalimonas lutea]
MMSEENGKTEEDAAADWEAALQEQGEEEPAGQDDAGGAASGSGQDAGVQRAAMSALQDEGELEQDENVNLDVILDIPVTLAMEIGRTKISIRHLLQLNQGSVVELDRLAGEPLDVLVNGTLIAHGEVVVVNERFGIRLTDVISPQERVKKLK